MISLDLMTSENLWTSLKKNPSVRKACVSQLASHPKSGLRRWSRRGPPGHPGALAASVRIGVASVSHFADLTAIGPSQACASPGLAVDVCSNPEICSTSTGAFGIP